MADMQLTSQPNGLNSIFFDKNSVLKSAAYTVVANDDNGKIFYSTIDNMVYTLPSIADGQVYTFVNMAEDGMAKMSISPAALDGIMYVTATDDKDLINTKATAKKGDSVTIFNVAGAVYWSVSHARGVFAKEA